MTRLWPCLLLLALPQPLAAQKAGVPYYGPAKRWHGIGYKFGYQDAFEKNGWWRTQAAVRSGDAAAVAMYRVAERAREQGYAYVYLLGGRTIRAPGINQAVVFAVPSHAATPPVSCPPRYAKSCYMADVAAVLRTFGGPDGTQPGVQMPDDHDRLGRSVFYSPYGVGAVSASATGTRPTIDPVPGGSATVAVPVPASPASVAVAPPVSSAAQRRFAAALKANQPVRGRDPKLGWTISD